LFSASSVLLFYLTKLISTCETTLCYSRHETRVVPLNPCPNGYTIRAREGAKSPLAGSTPSHMPGAFHTTEKFGTDRYGPFKKGYRYDNFCKEILEFLPPYKAHLRCILQYRKIWYGLFKECYGTHNFCKEIQEFLQGNRRLWPLRTLQYFITKVTSTVPQFWSGTHRVISPLRAFIFPLALPALPK